MDIDKIIHDAAVIRDERINYANTALRIGTLFMDIANAQKEVNSLFIDKKTYLDVLQKFIVGTLGNYDTSDELNEYLNSLSYNTLASGQYVANVGGVPFYVTHVCTSTADKRATMWVMGSLYVEEGKIKNDSDAGARIAYRSYKNDAWSSWDIMGDSISASIKVSQLDTYFMKEDSDGSVVVDIEKCEKAKPIYVVMDDKGNRVGLLFTHSDTKEHCLTLNLLTHLALKKDGSGSLEIGTHSHRYDYPKIYRKNLGFYFTSNAGKDDPGYFEELQASKWYCPLDEQFKKMVPTLQSGAVGDEKKYIYSKGGSDNTHTVLSGKIWIYQHSDRNQFLRFKHWGGANNTAQQDYSQVMLPNAWTGGNGLIRYDIYSRLDAFELREQNSTATEVKIITPIFTTGGTRELSISQATTAKAGVMTAEDKAYIGALKPWIIGSLGDYQTSDEFNTYLNGLSYNSLRSGQYVAKVGSVPFYVTFVITSTTENRATMWVMGSLSIENDKIKNDSDAGARIAYRIYKNGAWGSWDIMGYYKAELDSFGSSITEQAIRIVALEKKVAELEAKLK